MTHIAPAVAPTTSDRGSRRAAWIDSLRIAVIVGVIGSHVAVIYALDVGWWYEERTASEVATAVLAGVFAPGLLFGMGLMFFVAGWFTPAALEHKGARRFVFDRLWRLGIPTAAYLFLVNPVLNVMGDRAMGEVETLADYLRNTYWDDVELGVAWFMAALLFFSLAYAVWRRRHPMQQGAVLPLRGGDLVRAGAFIVVASFLVRVEFPVLGGDVIFTLNLWEYPQMAALFALGVLASERAWLSDPLSPRLRRACGRAAILGFLLAVLVGAGIAVTDDPEPFLGGWGVEATVIPLIEATLAVGMTLWLVDWFRRRATGAARMARAFGRASFAAYLLHVPITILLAIALRDFAVPGEIKFLGVFLVGVVGSFGLGWLVARSRAAGRIL